ncbi:hypothetical protein SEVIR_6G029200v4 [Setaria viridis]|uniref:RING-type domain-containing protein n=2 Tax=Setaria TaxID=4554 RepID=K3YK09_SETIT|nr:E3 ubiquitin-protein ligase SDIR1 [Setaria italica]XP_034601665.1 E3 ubiquitin-protein ligase SDIR1-like [Setaria viridis]RCV29680.1 hypothetical protein SETIT_6G031500v2 [Setaria italica]TKW08461.1 hypothetical protein SEVIR_6G029200v2 [Setaria viridis]
MDGEMDWIAARFLLSTILGVHPLVVLDDGDRDDERFPVDDGVQQRVTVPAAVEAPEGVAGVSVCAVCTEEVAAGQAVVRLPCAHWYHAGCIAPWLRIRTTCPTCRAELPREGGPERSRPAVVHAARLAEVAMETAGGRLRREASYTMLAGMLPS